jgi:dTMP kinase
MENRAMRPKRFYGMGLPGVDPTSLKGKLVVVEGADGSGRTTQVALLRDWLERCGYPTVEVGLKRSELVGPELEEAMQGNILSPLTLSLFYATDFANQIESTTLPAMRAGFTVLADRYIYTLMARDIARGADEAWVRDIYGFAPIPDIVFYLSVPPAILAERNFRKNGSLDYWESGMDIGRKGDMYQCFVHYQRRLQRTLKRMQGVYGFEIVNGNRGPATINRELRMRIARAILPEPLSGDRSAMEK